MRAPAGRVWGVYIFCCAVWGSAWVMIRVGLRDLPPFHFAAMRMTLACLLMAPLAWSRGAGRPTRSEAGWIAWSGLLQIGLAYALIFTSSQWIPSGLSAILYCTFPIWVGVFAHFLLPNEPLTPQAIGALALGLIGVALVQGPETIAAIAARDVGPLFLGGVLVLAAAMLGAYANVLNKQRFAAVSPFQNVWGQTLVGSVFLWLLARWKEQGASLHWTGHALLALGYLALFCTAMTFAGLFWLIPRVPVAVVGTIPLGETVFAVGLGAVVLGEKLSARVLVGGLFILAGVLEIARQTRAIPSP
ncbi:MAG TPA: DMT family transporter [Thermoanaerobaculia bacterium]